MKRLNLILAGLLSLTACASKNDAQISASPVISETQALRQQVIINLVVQQKLRLKPLM